MWPVVICVFGHVLSHPLIHLTQLPSAGLYGALPQAFPMCTSPTALKKSSKVKIYQIQTDADVDVYPAGTHKH